jgi:[ribosomal protein S18]-alanine N-acetyltransferase
MLWRQKSIVLRNLGAEDAPMLARLHAKSFHRGWTDDEFEQLIASSTTLGQGAAFSERGRLCGFVLSRTSGCEAEMLSIVVDASARRQGVGRALLAGHLECLRRQCVRKLYLEVDENNRPALAFYAALGLVEVGRRSSYYPRSSGGKAAALILRHNLDPMT